MGRSKRERDSGGGVGERRRRRWWKGDAPTVAATHTREGPRIYILYLSGRLLRGSTSLRRRRRRHALSLSLFLTRANLALMPACLRAPPACVCRTTHIALFLSLSYRNAKKIFFSSLLLYIEGCTLPAACARGSSPGTSRKFNDHSAQANDFVTDVKSRKRVIYSLSRVRTL